jgi:hypothetical protein
VYTSGSSDILYVCLGSQDLKNSIDRVAGAAFQKNLTSESKSEIAKENLRTSWDHNQATIHIVASTEKFTVKSWILVGKSNDIVRSIIKISHDKKNTQDVGL